MSRQQEEFMPEMKHSISSCVGFELNLQITYKFNATLQFFFIKNDSV